MKPEDLYQAARRAEAAIASALLYFGSLSIVGVGFVKIPPQFYEKGSFYV